MKYLVLGAVACAMVVHASAGQATSYPTETNVIALGDASLGGLNFTASGSDGTNDSVHYDYIYSFSLSAAGTIAAGYTGDYGEAHIVLYDQNPTLLSTESLYTLGDPDETTQTNAIDIGNESQYSIVGGASFDSGLFPVFYSPGTYYLRLFGTPLDDSVSLTGSISTVAATPLPASLPLFISGLGGLGFLRWRKKNAARA